MNVTRSIRLAALTTVLLLVGAITGSASARTVRCSVPKITGVSLKTARIRLSHAHCRTGTIHRPDTASGNLIVSRQSPRAGRKLRGGSRVTIWLRAKTVNQTLTTPTSTTPTPTTTTPTPPPPPPPTTGGPTVRANIDPSYTQDPGNPLKVTWAYDAGVDDGTLPYGTLSLTVYQHGQVASAGGCTIDVGGPVTGGNCTQVLPQYGAYDVTVSYASSSSSVAPSTATETDTIEPLPVTNTYTWGTDAPTQGAYIHTVLIGSAASVTVGDPNFEGAGSINLTDSAGAQCTAYVSGITATCQMTDIATPTSYTLSYPGGATTTSTVATADNGEQSVTSQWPASVVEISNPEVTLQQVSLVECGGEAPSASWGNSSNFGCASESSPKAWPSSLTVPAGASGSDAVFLDAWAYGSLQDDSVPDGTVNYTINPGVEGTDYLIDNTMCGTQCGFEEISFLTPGTYTVSTSFTSSDPNYPDTPGPSISVTVVP